MISEAIMDMPITREEVKAVLLQDNEYRKQKRWPLIPYDQIRELFFKCFGNTREIQFGFKEANWCRPISNELVRVVSTTGNKQKRVSLFKYFSERHRETVITPVDLVIKATGGRFILAGGALAGMMNRTREIKDLDMFYVGDADQATLTFQVAVEALKREYSHYSEVIVQRNKHVATVYFNVDYDDYDAVMMQFIFRVYPTKDQVIGGFDLANASFLYDGKMIYGTPLAAWSIANRVEILNLSRRSTSYEFRLRKYCKRYCLRLIVPGMRPYDNASFDAFTSDLAGYGLRFGITDEWVNKEVPLLFTQHAQPRMEIKSGDYEVKKLVNCENSRSNIAKMNTMLALRGLDSDIALMCWLEEDDDREEIVPMRTIDRAFLRKDLMLTPKHRYYYSNLNEIKHRVCKWLGEEDYARYQRALAMVSWDYEHPDVEFIYEEVKQRVQKTLSKFLETRQEITWITENPGRQWTASFNPIVKDVRDWYGEHYTRFTIGVSDEVVSTIFAARRQKGNPWSLLPRDVVLLILNMVLRMYQQDGVAVCLGDLSSLK